jgi:hypothetical protein
MAAQGGQLSVRKKRSEGAGKGVAAAAAGVASAAGDAPQAMVRDASMRRSRAAAARVQVVIGKDYR